MSFIPIPIDQADQAVVSIYYCVIAHQEHIHQVFYSQLFEKKEGSFRLLSSYESTKVSGMQRYHMCASFLSRRQLERGSFWSLGCSWSSCSPWPPFPSSCCSCSTSRLSANWCRDDTVARRARFDICTPRSGASDILSHES